MQQNRETLERTQHSPMSMSERIPWGRVLVEGVVIVGSILMAFGIEAWWADRGEKTAEQAALVRIHDELVADRSRLEFGATSQALRVAASLAVIELIDDLDGGAGVIDVPDSLLVRMVQTPTFEPRTPVLDGLRESGRIEVIRSAEVRAALSAFERALVNLSEAQADGRRIAYDQLIPAMSERGDVGHVLRNTIRSIHGSSWSELGLEGSTRLRADVSFKGLVSQRSLMLDQAGLGTTQSLAALDQLVAAIEKALDR